jgi:hypothetical protein
MSEAPEPVIPANLFDRYNEILREIEREDQALRRLRREVQAREAALKEQAHLKKLALYTMRLHHRELRRRAEAQLRKEQGIDVLPGFRSKPESAAQTRARVEFERRMIEREMRHATALEEENNKQEPQ